MIKAITVLGSMGLGAALMYLFDPNGGPRRRALMRDKAVGVSNDATEALGSKARDLRNRAKGVVHEAKSLVSGAGNSDKEISSQTQFGTTAN